MRFTPGGELFPRAPLPQSIGGVEVARFTLFLDRSHGHGVHFSLMIGPRTGATSPCSAQ